MTVKLVLFSFFVWAVLVQCSAPTTGVHTPEAIAEGVQSGEGAQSFCEGDECCSEHKECRRSCNRIFYKSNDSVKEKCRILPREIVDNLEELVSILKSPIVEDLTRLNLKQEFRLLLALDYRVFVRTIQSYQISTARDILIWFAENHEPVDELARLKTSHQHKILYETLASAGDRSKVGPVEEGLSQKISFDKSFFELIVAHSNYDLLQMIHEMIKENLCSASQYAGESQTELCILRIYCKEKYQQQDNYIHSEDLRNEMARNIDDEDFFKYVEKEILHTGLRVAITEPVINNRVCFNVCHDHNKGCQ